MLLAARDIARGGGPKCGRLLVLLTLGEESRNPSMPRAVVRAGPIDAAVIGEPTGLNLAVAQRGLVIAELAVSCGLLIAAGLMIKSVVQLRNVLLFEDRIEVQMHAWRGRSWARVSAQVYNEIDEYERLAGAVLARA